MFTLIKIIAFIRPFYFIFNEWQLPFKEIMIVSNEKKCKAITPMRSNYLILELSKDCTDIMIYPTFPPSVLCWLVSYSECYYWGNFESNKKVLIKKIINFCCCRWGIYVIIYFRDWKLDCRKGLCKGHKIQENDILIQNKDSKWLVNGQ